MGWQESRAMLLPPDRRLQVEASKRAVAVNGRPVLILSSVRQQGNGMPAIRLDDVRAWLEQRGFRVEERHKQDVRLTWQDVEAWLFGEDEDLSAVDLTFTLSRDAPARWGVWQGLVGDLCQEWNLRLADATKDETVGPEELLRLLSETISWQDFQRAFNWPSVAAVGK